MGTEEILALSFIALTVTVSGCTAEDISNIVNDSSAIENEDIENLTGEALEETNSTQVLEDIQEDQMTDLEIRTVYRGNNGNIHLSLRNTGERTLNFQEDIDFYINGFDYDVFPGRDNLDYSRDTLIGSTGCLSEAIVLDPGQTTADLDSLQKKSCDTGVEFPGAFEEPVTIEISLKDSHLSWEHECSPESGDQRIC